MRALLWERTVAGLNVSVDNTRRVQKMKGFKELVYDVLLVDLLEDARADHSMQVSLHKVKH